MTTVAFVSYRSGGIERRIGPLPKEHAEPMAAELARAAHITDVILEEWLLTSSTKVERP